MRLRLLSYNVRKAVGLDWRRRPERILAVLDEVAPDVVALQEADKRIGGRRTAFPTGLLRSHGGFQVLDSAPGPSIGWHGNAVLVRQGFTATLAGTLALPGLEPRGAVLARVSRDDGDGGTGGAGGAGGEEGAFLLVAAHLGLYWGSRRLQVAALLEATAGNALPLVIAGDLNDRAPARLLAPHRTEHGRDLRVVTPGRTFHAARPVVALDHMLLEGAVRVVAAGVHASPLARVASDHLPIWADLEVGPDPG